MPAENELHERTAVLEANDRNLFHRLSEIREELRPLSRIAANYETLAERAGAMEQKLGAIETRIAAIERAPAEDLRHYKRAAVTYLITGFLAAAAAGALAIFAGL